MKDPLFIRRLSVDEKRTLQAGLQSCSAFTRRRCHILLANAEGKTAPKIARSLGCATQTAVNALNAFAAEGLGCLIAKSHRPKSTRNLIEGASAEQVRALLCRSPQDFGRSADLWTLASLAEVAFEQGMIERAVSEQTIRQAIRRWGGDWKRARGWGIRLDVRDVRHELAAVR
jgi:transposase